MKQHNKVFAKGLRLEHEGHAVWPKVFSDDLMPGACGYWNGNGDWTTIAHLEAKDVTETAKTNTQPTETAGALTEAPDPLNTLPLDGVTQWTERGEDTWDPRKSHTVKSKDLLLEGEAKPPGTPVGAAMHIQYTCQASQGAVLLVRGSPKCDRLDGDDTAKEWVESNMSSLVGKNPKCIKKTGLWLVTKTHYATEAAKAVFQSEGNQASFYTDIKTPVAQAKASAAWWNDARYSSGWIIHRAPDSEQKSGILQSLGFSKPAPSPGVVVFFAGIQWKPHPITRKMRSEQIREEQEYLGGEADTAPVCIAELPDIGPGEDELAFLELRPSTVGMEPEKAEALGLQNVADLYELYENSDSDSE